MFMKMSVADVIEPHVYMEIDKSLKYEDAAHVTGKERCKRLAYNPLAATTFVNAHF